MWWPLAFLCGMVQRPATFAFSFLFLCCIYVSNNWMWYFLYFYLFAVKWRFYDQTFRCFSFAAVDHAVPSIHGLRKHEISSNKTKCNEIHCLGLLSFFWIAALETVGTHTRARAMLASETLILWFVAVFICQAWQTWQPCSSTHCTSPLYFINALYFSTLFHHCFCPLQQAPLPYFHHYLNKSIKISR